jgi:hypothetical protein
MTVPKRYQSKVKDFYRDQDGYWAILKGGYYNAADGGYDELHTIHEDVYSDVVKKMREIKALK